MLARSSAPPRSTWTLLCNTWPLPNSRMTKTPAKAKGTEPTRSHLAMPFSTVPRRQWTRPPTGFMNREATRSLPIAASGWTLKMMTRIGVISAPPPIPVRPTTKPTMSPASAIIGSMLGNLSLNPHHRSDHSCFHK